MMKKIGENLFTTNGWDVIKDYYHVKQAITDGTTFLLGNGFMGYRGTFAEDQKDQYTACIVTDTWDNADGKWEELSNVPNGLFLAIHYNHKKIEFNQDSTFSRSLDLKEALAVRDVKKKVDGVLWTYKEEKFVSYSHKNLIAMRISFSVDRDIEVTLKTGIDYDTWNINGEHLTNYKAKREDKHTFLDCETQEKGTKILVGSLTHFNESNIPFHEDRIFGEAYKLKLKANETYQIEKFMSVHTSNDVSDLNKESRQLLDPKLRFDSALKMHRLAWEGLWHLHDIKLEGSLIDQIALRYNIYQALIATPVHKPLPIGARGLSCQAYQGAAFWDQEIYNLPMYLHTNKSIARNLLVYRYNTLDGARKKAKKHGFEGAFYAWISGKTGDELCPDFFFKDVISNRPIRNHFNLWQIHISFDIAYTIHRYYITTDDKSFMQDYGIEMLIEIARFASSRVTYHPKRNRYELKQVQGPDEYHENVDNNAYTNYLAKYALEYTLTHLAMLDQDKLDSLIKRLSVTQEDFALWKDIHQKIYLPKPNQDGILEQFDGFFNLESIVPASDVTNRLINHEEYYGWPNGITVFTQCIKQADVVQLFSLYPNLFDNDTVKNSYEYYEPRTLHFSSLSPATHATVAAQIGKTDEAYRLFNKSVMIDLLNTNESISGGTFIGGTHTAANGASWQMVVYGFLGFSLDESKLIFNPRLPKAWSSVKTKLEYKDYLFTVEVYEDEFRITSNKPCIVPITIQIKDQVHTLSKQLITKI